MPFGYKNSCTDDVMKLRVNKDLSALFTFVIRSCTEHIGPPLAKKHSRYFDLIDENPNLTGTAFIYWQIYIISFA